MEIKLPKPINWDLKLKFFVLPNRPTPSLIVNKRWLRAIRLKRLVPVSVYVEGDRAYIDTPEPEVVDIVIEHLGLSDPTELYEHMNKDEALKKLKEKFYGFGRAGTMSIYVYEGVVKAVIQQQISFKVAENITAKLVEKFGEKCEYKNLTFYDFPKPEVLAELSVDELRGCGLSKRKAEVIKEVSSRAEELEELRNMSEKEVYELLTSFKGIGKWTAELVMSMALRFNVIPFDDLGVRRAISKVFGDVSREEVLKRVGRFGRDILYYLFLEDRLG